MQEPVNLVLLSMDFALSGTVNLHPGTVEIHGKLPLAVSLFKGKIKDVIKEKANELLEGHKTTDQ